MNQDTRLSSDKRTRAVHRLIAADRSASTANDYFEESFGALLGLNRTDARCVDIVQRFGRITAGHLAHESGLTTGAVTTALDRLEEAGYLRRVRDQADRRKIHVELTDLAKSFGKVVYEPIGKLFSRALADFSTEDMLVVARYLELSARVSREHADAVQRHIPPRGKSTADRMKYARKYLRDSEALGDGIIADWKARKLPENAYVSGKNFGG